MTTKPFDQAFKYLSEQDAEALLILLGILQPGEQATIETLPTELSVSTIVADQIYLVTTTHGQFIVHIEAQVEWRAELVERLPEYDARIWMKFRLPVFSFVLMLRRKGLPRTLADGGRIQAGWLAIESAFRIIRLWNLDAKFVFESERESLLPLVPLMKASWRDVEETVHRLRDISDEQRRRDLGLHFLMLGGLHYNRKRLLELVMEENMIPLEQLKDSSFYQYILEEGEKIGLSRGIEEGKREGKREGIREGRKEAAAESLRLLVEKRFPKLDVKKEIAQIRDVALLQQLCVELLDMPDARAFRRRLNAILKAKSSS
jgi:predicted transposase YdaD